jgi:hypothetical protein
MEDFTLPSVGAKFKKIGVLYIHSPQMLDPFPNFLKKPIFIFFKYQKY